MLQCAGWLAGAVHVRPNRTQSLSGVRGHVEHLLILRSKWFLADIGHEGLNNLLAAYPDKSAEAVCTFGYSEGPGHDPIIFQGRCAVSHNVAENVVQMPKFYCLTQRVKGKIVPARGPLNFGMASNLFPLIHQLRYGCVSGRI